MLFESIVLSWPVHILDFEASSLEDGSYPIEVGLATWSGREGPISVWSTLIRLADEWRRSGHWSNASGRVHGITRRELSQGVPPRDVATILNKKLGHDVVWCDGGPYDAYWLRTLFDAAGIEPTFVLGDWNTLLGGLPEVCRARILTMLGAAPPGHRAGADAERLLRALAVGIGVRN